MNRAWRSRAIRQIGFFAILAVLGLMVVRWYFFMRAQAMPTTLDMTYSNQQNNKRAGYTFTIGDAVYYPVNSEGNSVFEIPVSVFNKAMEVIADTTAMGNPHEIAYTLTFDWDSAEKE